jgi:hypothetical protein
MQLYTRRTKYTKPSEAAKWKEISYHFMSEESGGDDDHMVHHTLPWRSDGKYIQN